MAEIALVSTDTVDHIYVEHRLIAGFAHISHDDMASLLGPDKDTGSLAGLTLTDFMRPTIFAPYQTTLV